MTGRPGYRTMEMIGGSSASYLACTPCVPLFVHCLIRVEAEGLLDFQGRAGIISIVRWNLCPVIFGVDHIIGKQAEIRTNFLNIFVKMLGTVRPSQFFIADAQRQLFLAALKPRGPGEAS